MKRSVMYKAIGVTAVMISGLLGCERLPVGNTCAVGEGGSNAVISSGAPECASRLCLQAPALAAQQRPDVGNPTAQCTALCSVDEDCEGHASSTCQTGFSCAVPLLVGPFGCERMCVCNDFLPDSGQVTETPAACVDQAVDQAADQAAE